eukprot:6373605-Amphidinium_carterae.3
MLVLELPLLLQELHMAYAAAAQASEPNLRTTELNDLASETESEYAQYANKTWELMHQDRNRQ